MLFYSLYNFFCVCVNTFQWRAVQREHCEQSDSDVEFETRNYRIKSTPRKEWQFVFDCENAEDLKLTRGMNHSGENLGLRERITTKELRNKAVERMKKLAGLDVTEEELNGIKLSEEEIGCLRLYTGLFFCLFFILFICFESEKN